MAIARPALMGVTVSLSLALGLLTACKGATVTPVAPLKSAAKSGEVLAPIELDRIVFDLDRGEVIGAYRGGKEYTGCGRSFSVQPIHWWMDRVSVKDEAVAGIFTDEMRRAGYKVTGDPTQLFSDVSADAVQAEYLIGGRVDTVLMDVCDEASMLGGRSLGTQYGEISMDVTWQVFSLLERKVVLETRSRGSAKLEEGIPDGEVELLLRGLAAAAANLAADGKFHELLLAKEVTSASTVAADWPAIRLRAAPALAGGIAGNMQRIQTAVVTIRGVGGQGSGFFVAPDLILTNEHVVGAAPRHKILLINGRDVYARTLRRDAGRDVALLQVESGTYPFLSLRRDTPNLAEEVYAIGSPLDESLAGTVTKGIVSQLKRDARGLEIIQADVTVQPGSSGGPLLDADGAVVGLSQSGLTDGSDHSIGINFFVPIAAALKALNITGP